MQPQSDVSRRRFLSTASLSLGVIAWGGCSAMSVRSQSPEDSLETSAANTRYIGDVALPYGLNPITIEAVSLVTGLKDTGSDPPPSTERSMLIAEMQAREVPNPNQILALPTTELVLVRAFLRPGIQKGDHFDVEIRVPSRSTESSLRDGWLLETHLRQVGVYDNRVRQGNSMGIASGAVLIDPSASGDDSVQQGRGRILGGGVSSISRELGLVIRDQNRSVLTSAQIGEAINRRFHMFEAGIKTGVAKPKTDEFVNLRLHPRYRDNIDRFVRVVRSLPLRETKSQQLVRVNHLERQLLDPITSSTAALRLEALGNDGVPSLKKGLESPDEEVRFYSAEALAYLDVEAAAPVLGELARNVPAFRANALSALSAMDDLAAYESLEELLHVPSAETRYGAFRALWTMNRKDPLVRGENLGGMFSYHVLHTSGPPMIHATYNRRPEIVVYGHEQKLTYPVMLDVGRNIVIKSQDRDRVSVSRFSVSEPDQKRIVSHSVDDILRAVVELGGTYPDVVQTLQAAKTSRVLAGRFEIDAVPRGGRSYNRETEELVEETPSRSRLLGNPLPELFSRREPIPAEAAESAEQATADSNSVGNDSVEWENKPKNSSADTTEKSFFGRLFRRG